MIYKFVKWEIPPLDKLDGSFPYLLHKQLEEGIQPTRAEKDRAFSGLCHNSYSKTGIPLQGWMFDFRDWLKEYFVEFDYGHIERYWAFDKTSIRNEFSGRISRIVEVK